MTGRAGPRKAARERGEKRYFTGAPCPRGHVAERFVSTKACVVCARDCLVTWKRENPERVVRARKAWDSKNSDRVFEHRRNAYRRNPAKWFAASKLRKQSLRNRTPCWADRKRIEAVYQEARLLRDGGHDVVVDHVIPLHGETVSGLHVHTNLQIIGAKANLVKSNSFV